MYEMTRHENNCLHFGVHMMVTENREVDGPGLSDKTCWPDEAELRAEFTRQHRNLDLRQHKLHGSYRRSGVDALWKQHCRTAAWMASRRGSRTVTEIETDTEIESRERSYFERQMGGQGVKDFTRRPGGRYENMVLEWYWEGWCAHARATAKVVS
jgi:hypothetical protein